MALKRFIFHGPYFLEEDDSEKIKDEFLYIRENEWLKDNSNFQVKPNLFKYFVNFQQDSEEESYGETSGLTTKIYSFFFGFFFFILGVLGIMVCETDKYLNSFFFMGVILRASTILYGIISDNTIYNFELLVPGISLLKSFVNSE